MGLVIALRRGVNEVTGMGEVSLERKRAVAFDLKKKRGLAC